MNLRTPIGWLQWTVGLVIGYAALLLLLQARQGPLHGGIHRVVAGTLAGVELIAAILFLIPRTVRWGGRLLWGVLVAAALLHLHTGDPPPAIFLVYAAAIWVVISQANPENQSP